MNAKIPKPAGYKPLVSKIVSLTFKNKTRINIWGIIYRSLILRYRWNKEAVKASREPPKMWAEHARFKLVSRSQNPNSDDRIFHRNTKLTNVFMIIFNLYIINGVWRQTKKLFILLNNCNVHFTYIFILIRFRTLFIQTIISGFFLIFALLFPLVLHPTILKPNFYLPLSKIQHRSNFNSARS